VSAPTKSRTRWETHRAPELGSQLGQARRIRRGRCQSNSAQLPLSPDLPDWLEPYWDAFWRLSPFRGQGVMGGWLRITEQAIKDDAASFGPDDPDDFADFKHLIAAMDDAWLLQVERMQKQMQSKR